MPRLGGSVQNLLHKTTRLHDCHRQRVAHHQGIPVLEVGARCIGQASRSTEISAPLSPPGPAVTSVFRSLPAADRFVFQTRNNEIQFLRATGKEINSITSRLSIIPRSPCSALPDGQKKPVCRCWQALRRFSTNVARFANSRNHHFAFAVQVILAARTKSSPRRSGKWLASATPALTSDVPRSVVLHSLLSRL